MTPLATPLSSATFALLVWGAVGVVALVFVYEVAVLVRDLRRAGRE